MPAHIFAQGKSVSDIFKDTRRVPAYQRDYSWQPKRQVKALWEDILAHIEGHAEDDYLLGPIIVTRDSVSDVIDGQQRLITLFLLQAAFRYRLIDLGGDAGLVQGIENGLVEYDDETGTMAARIRHHDKLAEQALVDIARLNPEGHDANKLKVTNKSLSRRRIILAFQYLLRGVNELGEDKEILATKVRNIRRQVQLIEIETTDAVQAIYVFERANSRGKPLDPSDLLKNLIFQKFTGDFDDLAHEWRKIQGIIEDCAGIQIMDFLRWYHLGAPNGFYATSRDFIDKVDVFLKNQDAMDYVRAMTESARALKTMSSDMKLEPGAAPSPNLSGVRIMSNGRQRSHWPVLLATAKWSVAARETIAKQLERVIFYSSVCEIRSQDVERSMREITIAARVGGEGACTDIVNKLESIAFEYYHEHFFVAKFVKLSYEDDSHLVRYALKKIHDGLYVEYYGGSPSQADAGSGHFLNAEVEHVWPQVDGDALATEEDSELVHRIGNLVLLSRAINAAGGRKQAEAKLSTLYQEEDSKFLIANCLARPLPSSGKNAHARAINLCPTGFAAWDASAIERLAHSYLALFERYVGAPVAPPKRIRGSEH